MVKSGVGGSLYVWLPAVWLLSAAACGSDAPSGPEWTSGGRLRARVFQTADGAKQWIAWHDTARGEDCYFARTGDGSYHCIPGDAQYSDIFADPGCSQPMAPTSSECGALPYIWHIDSPCDVGYTVHRVGTPISPPPATYYFRGYDGSCLSGGETDARFEYVALEPAIDASEFVSAELVEEPNGPVNNRRLVASDGARQLTGQVIDPATGALMSTTWAHADVVRWIPRMYNASAYFADGACTDLLGCSWTSSCESLGEEVRAPYVEQFTENAACGFVEATYYEAGDPAIEQSLDTGAECLAVEPTQTCVALGAPVPRETWPEHQIVDLGTGRIRARYDAVAGGGATGPAWFYFHDSELDVDCFPLNAIDGSFRCLPSFFIPYANLFSDAACTLPAAFRPYPGDACFPEPPVTLVTWREPDTTPCVDGHFSDAPRRTYRLGDVLSFAETAGLFTEDAGPCAPYDPASQPGEVRALVEMAPEEFVAVSDIVE
jgi:hypothetical protein